MNAKDTLKSKTRDGARKIIGLDNGSHLGALMTAIERIGGPVLECGAGFYSSLTLLGVASTSGLQVITLENKDPWFQWADHLRSLFFDVGSCLVFQTWDKVPRQKYSVALIDSHPRDRRKDDWRMAAEVADVLILHDAQRDYSDFEPSPHSFEFSYLDECEGRPHTLVVSNEHDVEAWFE